jgi:hypothetical protein
VKLLLAASLPLVGAACSALPDLEPAAAVSAPATAPVASPAMSGPRVSYVGYHVDEPEDWRTLNDKQREGGE